MGHGANNGLPVARVGKSLRGGGWTYVGVCLPSPRFFFFFVPQCVGMYLQTGAKNGVCLKGGFTVGRMEASQGSYDRCKRLYFFLRFLPRLLQAPKPLSFPNRACRLGRARPCRRKGPTVFFDGEWAARFVVLGVEQSCATQSSVAGGAGNWDCSLGASTVQVIRLNRANATALIKLRRLARKCVHFCKGAFLLKSPEVGIVAVGEEGLGRDVSRFLRRQTVKAVRIACRSKQPGTGFFFGGAQDVH